MSKLSNTYCLFLLLVSFSYAGYAQEIDYTLREIQVKVNLQEYYDEDTQRDVLDSVLRDRFAFSSLGDVLLERGGIVVSSYGSRGSLAGIKMRGTGDNHTRFLWNGIPVNSLTTGTMDASLLPAGFMESVAITKGASGVVAGNSSFGGAIYMDNTPVWNRGTEASMVAESGSHGYWALMPSIRLSSDRIQYKANFQVLRSDNDFPFHDIYKPGSPLTKQLNDSLEQWGLMQNLFIRIKANTEISIGSWLQDKNKDIPSVMGSYQAAYASQSDKSNKSYIKVTRSFGGSRLLLQAAYLLDSLQYTKLDSDNPENYLINSHITTKSFISRAEWRWFVNQKFTFDLGAHTEHPRAIVDSYGEVKKENRASIIGAAKYRHRSWIANIGLRKEFNPYNPPKPLASLGLSWKSKNRQSMIRGNISNKFRIPSFNERYWQPGGNPDLLPESGWGGELAWRWEKRKNEYIMSRIEPVLYFQRIRNWIQWVPAEGYWIPQNQDLMQSRGVELNGYSQVKMQDWNIKWDYKYSYTDAAKVEENQSEDKTAVIYIPKNQVFTGLTVKYRRITTGINYRYMGKRFTSTDQDPVFALDDIHLVNFHASYKQFWNQLEVDFYIRLNNLFNHQYQMIRSYATPGFSGVAGLKIMFLKTKT